MPEYNTEEIKFFLIKLMEEAAEVIQAASKILTFGSYNYNPYTQENLPDSKKILNIDDLEKEIGHIEAITDMLVESTYLNIENIIKSKYHKIDNIKPSNFRLSENI